MSNFTHYKLEAAFTSLKDFDIAGKDSDFLEVTMWHNGEGFTACLSSHGEQLFQMTWGQFKALKKLVKDLDGT